MEGNLADSDERNIRGQTTFRWLPGGWRPNPGADETVNVAYDIGGRRVG
jgi:hypothetical protein